MKKLLFAASIFIFSSAVLLSGDKGWILDKAHSNIGFSVKHMVISKATGNFKKYDVTFNATKEDFSDGYVEALIDVASINTDNEKRDAHLKSDDFFNAEKFPQIKFKSSSFKKINGNKYKITGALTMRDVTKQVAFDAEYNGTVKSPWGATVCSWSATTSVNRFDYGLKWNKAIEAGGLIVGDMVTINMDLEFTK
jgi:polyisoprenoid-binding protein YceI